MDYEVKGVEWCRKAFRYLTTICIPSVDNNYEPKILTGRYLMYLVIFVFLLKMVGFAITQPLPGNIFFADVTKADLVRMLNTNRQQLGIIPLKESVILNEAALLKAQDMVQKNYFAHKSPEGLTPWFWFRRVGYTYKYAGENLAIGFIDSPDVFNAWLNSPGHKANMVNPNYREVGTAVLPNYGNNNTIVVVQLFGSALPKTAQVVTKKEPQKNASAIVVQTQEPQSIVKNPSEVKNQVLGEEVIPNSLEEKQLSLYEQIIGFIEAYHANILQIIAYSLLIVIGVLFVFYVLTMRRQTSYRVAINTLAIVIILFISTFIYHPTLGTEMLIYQLPL